MTGKNKKTNNNTSLLQTVLHIGMFIVYMLIILVSDQ